MKASHKAIQRSVDAITPQRVGNFEVNETPEEKRENLVKKAKMLSELLASVPKKSDQRKILGKELCEVNLEINKLKVKKDFRNIENYFIDIFKEIYGQYAFDLIMNKAIDRKNGIEKSILFSGNVKKD